MHRMVSALLAGSTWASVVLPGSSYVRTPGPTVATPLAVITLEPFRTRWAMNVVAAGHTRKFMLDTGGGITLISPSVAAEAGCTPWGRATGFRMFGDRGDTPFCEDVALDLGGYRVAPPIAGVVDIASLNPRDSALSGSLALDAFENQAVTLDLANGTITVESDASLAERTRGMTPIPIRLSREVQGRALEVFAAVPTAKGTLWMELDSGNGGTVLVSKPVAASLGLDPNGRGKQSAEFALLPSVRVQTSDAFTPDMIMDGNLGMPFLRHWVVTLDLRAARGWISPASPPHV